MLVDDDINIRRLARFKMKGLKDKYTLFTAEHGKQAVEILQSKPIDYVLTDLNMPHMDGLELLSYITRFYPAIPVTVMTGKDAREVKESFVDPGILNILNKSETLLKLVQHVEETLSQAHQQGAIKGISLANFLQLLEMEQKTYLLEIENPGGEKGFFFISQGEPIDAICDNLKGEEAALKMISWDQVEIRFRNIPSHKIKKTINRGLMSLILEGVRLKDEKGQSPVARDPATDLNGTDPMGLDTFFDYPDEVRETDPPTRDEPETGVSPPLFSAGPAHQKIMPDPPQSTREIIQGLKGVKGVKAVFLVGKQGEIIESAGLWPGSDTGVIGTSVAAVNAGAQRLSSVINMNNMTTMTFEYNDATFMCQPVNESLLVVLSPNSNTLGIIRQKVKKHMPELLHNTSF
jgi:CheY-like chemotaxis protein/predicted regulator of Ras-like GTPase activity (Roadblock/LC7/MglB family)